MPKRPGSPLEPENNRKGPRFFAESRNKLENDIPPLGDQSSTIQHQGEPEGGNEEPSSPPPSSMNEQGSEQEPDLQQLLSVEGLNTREEIEARFHAIARQLFANYRIRIQPGNTKSESNSVAAGEADKNEKGPCVELQLMEIEFYLISPNVHEDPYCHGSLEQTRSGCWYFHRAPKWSASSTHTPSAGGEYRSGSRKGLDLTLGAAIQPTSGPQQNVLRSDKPRGGILLRSVRVVSTGVVISGPSLLVDFILRTCGVEDIKTLVSEKWEEDTFAFNLPNPNSAAPQLSFTRVISESPNSNKKSDTVTYYTTPRVGLDLSHATAKPEAKNPRIQFVQRPYRFLVEPHLLKVNGRPQTFIGLLHHAEEKLRVVSWPYSQMDKSRILQNIASIGGFSSSVTRNYLQHYETGIKGGSAKVASFCRMQGVTQSVEKLLQMFGALRAAYAM